MASRFRLIPIAHTPNSVSRRYKALHVPNIKMSVSLRIHV